MEYSNPLRLTEVKATGDEWTVSGYVAVFDNIDLGGDVVLPGAFSDTLRAGHKVRFLFDHDPARVLGSVKSLTEDKTGLFGDFRISKTQLGQDTRQLLLDGAIDSFSFGYESRDWKMRGKVRELKKLDLYEASLVSLPMNRAATVTGVKEFETMAQKAAGVTAEMARLLDDLRGLVGTIDRPLTETKRRELTELLAQCAGLDAVRSDLESVLSAAPVVPTREVDARFTNYQLGQARKRLAHLLQKE